MEKKDLLDFNFWPSFADSMLAVVFILVVILVFVAQHGLAGIQDIRSSQKAVVKSIAGQYQGTVDTLERSPTQSEFVIRRNGEPEVEIREDVQLQRITFRGNVLFSQNDYRLTQRGQNVLSIVGKAIQPRLDRISQVQIEGHTDIYPTDQYAEGNLELGSRRAMSVFQFLTKQVGIDPARHLISATSYGKYKPVGRFPGESYDEDELWKANNDADKRRRNRRIELLLFYESADEDSSGADAPAQPVQREEAR